MEIRAMRVRSDSEDDIRQQANGKGDFQQCSSQVDNVRTPCILVVRRVRPFGGGGVGSSSVMENDGWAKHASISRQAQWAMQHNNR